MKPFCFLFLLFFNSCVTKCAQENAKTFSIDIYLPIFSCLDEFVAGNLFYPVNEGEEYGKIWEGKGYTKNKKYPPLLAESVNLIVDTRLGLSRWGKGMSWYDVFLPIYVFKKDNFFIRFFFADTYAYPSEYVCNPDFHAKFVGNINVFCWLGNIKNIVDINNGYPAAPGVNNESPDKIVVEKGEDLEKVVLSKPVEIFYSPGKRLKKYEPAVGFLKYKEKLEEDPQKLEFDHNIFSFVFLGEDPFSEDYSDVYCKKDRVGLTVEQSEDDIINDKTIYFDYFNSKIKSLFDLDKIRNFLGKQKDFLGDKTSSAAEDIKKLLDNAFVLLKSYSDRKLETQATVVSEVNCCENCCG